MIATVTLRSGIIVFPVKVSSKNFNLNLPTCVAKSTERGLVTLSRGRWLTTAGRHYTYTVRCEFVIM